MKKYTRTYTDPVGYCNFRHIQVRPGILHQYMNDLREMQDEVVAHIKTDPGDWKIKFDCAYSLVRMQFVFGYTAYKDMTVTMVATDVDYDDDCPEPGVIARPG